MTRGGRLGVLTALLALLSAGKAADGFFVEPSKGLYANGLVHEFWLSQDGILTLDGSLPNADGTYSPMYQNRWAMDGAFGNIGACIYAGVAYCFFTTNRGTLEYVTTVPDVSHGKGALTVVASGLPVGGPGFYNGTAAAVVADTLWVFTPTVVFRSGDGRSFSAIRLGPNNQVGLLDAITVYPPHGTARVLLVYNDEAGTLHSSLFNPDQPGFSAPTALPWPPAAPTLWSRVMVGNLLAGTSNGGAREPCAQFYGLTDQSADGWHQGRWEYRVNSGSWAFQDITFAPHDVYLLTAYPLFETLDSRGTMKQRHVLHEQDPGIPHRVFFDSDYLVPQHNDPSYGWDGVPTQTATATGDDDESRALRSFWTLVGIVLGPPPFAKNGAADAGFPAELSRVEYGHSQSTSITTTHSTSKILSLGVNSQIKGGFGKAGLDLSYAHGWLSSHSTTSSVEVSSFYRFGPADETPPDQGVGGWAIFDAPVFVTQQYKVYAYDYNLSSGQGTYLGQDLYATGLGAVTQQTAYFDLQHPEDGTISDLFKGLTAFPASTDLKSWLGIREWNQGGSDWSVIFGDRSNPPVGTLNQGVATTQVYSQTRSTLDSRGNTNSFGVKASTSFNLFQGFSAGVTVGLDTEVAFTTDTESAITDSVSCSLSMPVPAAGSPPDYVKSLVVQPYWLRANTVHAPWIPPTYGGNLPWCITWDVLSYRSVGGAVSGQGPAPAFATGTVRHGAHDEDTYAVDGGRLGWLDSQGLLTPLPLAAADFDPYLGASVSLNGFSFQATSANGAWTRRGEVWRFVTGDGASERCVLALDFEGHRWSFSASSQRLDTSVKASDGLVHVVLEIQGEYRFSVWADHDVSSSWQHEEVGSGTTAHGVHVFSGTRDSRLGTGTVTVKGHLPPDDPFAGDLEIRINSASVFIPVLSTDGFLEAASQGGVVAFESDGLSFQLDLAQRAFAAEISGNAFQRQMAPRGGRAHLQVLVGGQVVSDQVLEISRHTTTLSMGARPPERARELERPLTRYP